MNECCSYLSLFASAMLRFGGLYEETLTVKEVGMDASSGVEELVACENIERDEGVVLLRSSF